MDDTQVIASLSDLNTPEPACSTEVASWIFQGADACYAACSSPLKLSQISKYAKIC